MSCQHNFTIKFFRVAKAYCCVFNDTFIDFLLQRRQACCQANGRASMMPTNAATAKASTECKRVGLRLPPRQGSFVARIHRDHILCLFHSTDFSHTFTAFPDCLFRGPFFFVRGPSSSSYKMVLIGNSAVEPMIGSPSGGRKSRRQEELRDSDSLYQPSCGLHITTNLRFPISTVSGPPCDM